MIAQIFACVVILIGLATSASAEFLVKPIDPIKVSAKIHGHGRVNIILNTERTHSANIQGKYYQGIYKHRGQEYPVAASKINGTLKVIFSGKTTGSRQSRKRLYRLKIGQNGTNTRAHGIPTSAHSSLPCGAHTEAHEHTHRPQVANITSQSTTLYRVISISTFADPQWVAIYGANTNAIIAEQINVAEALFERQLNIRFNIVSQDIFSDISSEPNSSLALQQFRVRPELNGVSGAVKYLFSGSTFNSRVIGIAYVGSLCYAPQYSVGIVTSYGDLSPIIFAHELGHTLSASHDVTAYNNVMYPSISPDISIKYFTDNSKKQIESFLAYDNSCISYENLPPSLNGAKLKLRRNKNVIVGNLTAYNNLPISNKQISIKINKRIYFVKTNISGKVTRTIRAPKKTRMSILAQVVEKPTIFARLNFTL